MTFGAPFLDPGFSSTRLEVTISKDGASCVCMKAHSTVPAASWQSDYILVATIKLGIKCCGIIQEGRLGKGFLETVTFQLGLEG